MGGGQFFGRGVDQSRTRRLRGLPPSLYACTLTAYLEFSIIDNFVREIQLFVYILSGGLLGIYDNEPSNDWMNPEREVISSLEDFVKSWTMDKGKNCPIKFSDQMIPSTSIELDTCAEIFKTDNSPLKPCFSSINPEPFNDMCIKVNLNNGKIF